MDLTSFLGSDSDPDLQLVLLVVWIWIWALLFSEVEFVSGSTRPGLATMYFTQNTHQTNNVIYELVQQTVLDHVIFALV